MTQAHTPGPWRLGATHKDGSYAIHAKTASIIHATPFDSSRGQAEANARLLAAAPQLLAALERLTGCFSATGSLSIEPHVSQHVDVDEPSQAQTILHAARAAIAKAKGE